MNIYMNKFAYDYDANGNVSDAQVGLYGSDADGEYVSCNLVIKADELGKDKTFDNITISDVRDVAKKKALAYLQPDDKKKADTTTKTDEKVDDSNQA